MISSATQSSARFNFPATIFFSTVGAISLFITCVIPYIGWLLSLFLSFCFGVVFGHLRESFWVVIISALCALGGFFLAFAIHFNYQFQYNFLATVVPTILLAYGHTIAKRRALRAIKENDGATTFDWP